MMVMTLTARTERLKQNPVEYLGQCLGSSLHLCELTECETLSQWSFTLTVRVASVMLIQKERQRKEGGPVGRGIRDVQSWKESWRLHEQEGDE